MKKIISALIVFIVCISLVACGGEAAPQEEQPVKNPLTEDQNAAIVKVVEKLENIDMLGESVVFSRLSGEDALSAGELCYNMKYSGFAGMAWEMYCKMALKYFNVPQVAPAEIKCWLCGRPVVSYTEADGYANVVEAHTHDTRGDVSRAYNIYQESWTDGEKYYLTMYKLFPDLMKNTDPAAINFYASYADAASMENVLFTAADDAQFADFVEKTDFSDFALYTYVFTADENGKDFKLEEYRF